MAKRKEIPGPVRTAWAALALGVGLLTIAQPAVASLFGIDVLLLVSLFILLFSAAQSLTVPGTRYTFVFWLLGGVAILAGLRPEGYSPFGAGLLAASAFGFQARLWLLQLSGLRLRERHALADAISAAASPETASVFVDHDIESTVALTSLRAGHIFRVSAGQRLPADGHVTFGSGFVDETLGGQAKENLRLKGMGSHVYAGTRVKNGSLLVCATSLGTETFAARLAASLREGAYPWWALFPDAALLLLGLALCLLGPAPNPAYLLLTSSGAALFALLVAGDFSFARAGAERGWHFRKARGVLSAGMLVTPAPGVLSEGRPKLAAVETTGRLSEDAAIGLLAPLARKIETPAAFALLLELRARNIPLELSEFFEPAEGGGCAIVAGKEVRWLPLDGRGTELPPLGALESFAREHQSAGEEVCLLELEGTILAALAFRDEPVKGARDAAELLRDAGFPVLLVSPLPKRCTSRLESALGVEHAQGESGPRETEALVSRLAGEGLSPAWIQTGRWRPAKATSVLAQAAVSREADLSLLDVSLPSVAAALAFAERARTRTRAALGTVLGVQLGLVVLVLAADPVLAPPLHFGRGWPLNPFAVAVLGAVPGFLAFFLAHARAEPGPP